MQLALEDFYYKRSGVVIAADGAADAARRRGTLQITSQRLIWYDGGGRATSVPAAAIAEASPRMEGFLFSKVHKVRIHIAAPDFWGELRFATKADARAAGEAFVTVRKRLAKEAREEAERAAAEVAAETERKARLGIAGIRTARDRERLAASKLGTEAFSDLASLMSKAKQIVVLTERYRTAAEAPVGGASSSATSAGALAAARSIGIACPVTRGSVGNDDSRYHEELSREIGAYLAAGPLDAAGGIMSMVDVWCHYNRARGVDLVSPGTLRTRTRTAEPYVLPLYLYMRILLTIYFYCIFIDSPTIGLDSPRRVLCTRQTMRWTPLRFSGACVSG